MILFPDFLQDAIQSLDGNDFTSIHKCLVGEVVPQRQGSLWKVISGNRGTRGRLGELSHSFRWSLEISPTEEVRQPGLNMLLRFPHRKGHCWDV